MLSSRATPARLIFPRRRGQLDYAAATCDRRRDAAGGFDDGPAVDEDDRPAELLGAHVVEKDGVDVEAAGSPSASPRPKRASDG